MELERDSGMPNKDGLEIWAIPLGPNENSFQFSSIRRMISPKPKVTMAR